MSSRLSPDGSGYVVPQLTGREGYKQWADRCGVEFWYNDIEWLFELGLKNNGEYLSRTWTNSRNWVSANKSAVTMIVRSLGENPHKVIMGERSAVAIWEKLQEKYTLGDSCSGSFSLSSFNTQKREKTESIEGWAHRLHRAWVLLPENDSYGRYQDKVPVLDDEGLKKRFVDGLNIEKESLPEDIDLTDDFDPMRERQVVEERFDLSDDFESLVTEAEGLVGLNPSQLLRPWKREKSLGHDGWTQGLFSKG